MIVNIHQSANAEFYKVREKKAVKPSTYKERVLADRIVMAILFLGGIIFAVITA